MVQGVRNVITTAGVILPLDKTASYNLLQSNTGVLLTKPVTSASTIYYIPGIQDSVITSNRINKNAIMINDKTILDTVLGVVDPDVVFNYLDDTDYGAGVYSVVYRGKQVGSLVLYRPGSSLLQQV